MYTIAFHKNLITISYTLSLYKIKGKRITCSLLYNSCKNAYGGMIPVSGPTHLFISNWHGRNFHYQNNYTATTRLADCLGKLACPASIQTTP